MLASYTYHWRHSSSLMSVSYTYHWRHIQFITGVSIIHVPLETHSVIHWCQHHTHTTGDTFNSSLVFASYTYHWRHIQFITGVSIIHVPLETRSVHRFCKASSEKHSSENGFKFKSLHYNLKCKENYNACHWRRKCRTLVSYTVWQQTMSWTFQ